MNLDIDDSIVWKLWSVALSVMVLSTAILSIVFPKRFYDQFVWKYFWGPIVADGHGVSQVERLSGQTYIPSSGLDKGVTAEPGYTVVSTLSYAIILIFAIIGIVILLDRFDFNLTKETVASFVPLMIFGGLLRVAEDLNVFVYIRTDQFVIPFPYSSLMISPIIYFVLFGVGLTSLITSKKLSDDGYVSSKEKVIALIGSVLSVGILSSFLIVSISNSAISPNPSMVISTFILSTAVSGLIYYIFREYTNMLDGVEFTGFFLLWAHSLDGFANVISLDWLGFLGIQARYNTKHVVNEAVRLITGSVQPEWLTDTIGVTWPFLFVKLGIVVFLLWVLNEEFFDESRRLAVLTLLIGIAVGLGPATRDVMRVTMGI